MQESLALEPVFFLCKELAALNMLGYSLSIELIEPQLNIVFILHHRRVRLSQLQQLLLSEEGEHFWSEAVVVVLLPGLFLVLREEGSDELAVEAEQDAAEPVEDVLLVADWQGQQRFVGDSGEGELVDLPEPFLVGGRLPNQVLFQSLLGLELGRAVRAVTFLWLFCVEGSRLSVFEISDIVFPLEGSQKFSERNLFGLLQKGGDFVVLKVGFNLVMQVGTLELLFEITDGCDFASEEPDQGLFVGVLEVGQEGCLVNG